MEAPSGAAVDHRRGRCRCTRGLLGARRHSCGQPDEETWRDRPKASAVWTRQRTGGIACQGSQVDQACQFGRPSSHSQFHECQTVPSRSIPTSSWWRSEWEPAAMAVSHPVRTGRVVVSEATVRRCSAPVAACVGAWCRRVEWSCPSSPTSRARASTTGVASGRWRRARIPPGDLR